MNSYPKYYLISKAKLKAIYLLIGLLLILISVILWRLIWVKLNYSIKD